MSEGESKIEDQQGKFTQVVKSGRKVPDIEWIPGRILLSNKRVVLASSEGKRTIPLSKVQSIKGRQDANKPLAQVSSYLSLQVGNEVTLIAPKQHEQFEQALYKAVLDQQVVLIKHPAVEGGVVQGKEWEKGRLTLDEGEVAVAIASGQFLEIEIDDVGTVDSQETEIMCGERFVIEVEHTEEGTEENEVLMALYSGVSPFQIPNFVGMDIDRVEEIYDQLIEKGVLEEQRTRREVALQARGRHIAGEAMDEE